MVFAQKVKVVKVFLMAFLIALVTPLELEKLNLRELQRDVSEAPYQPEEYVEGEIDCSNMAMLLAKWLEKKGYSVEIVIGTRWIGEVPHERLVKHVWLIVDKTVIVEPTLKKIIRKQDFYKDFFWHERYAGTVSIP